METTEFWAIISRVHEGANGVMDQKCILLEQELDTLSDWDEETVEALYPGLSYLGGGDEPPPRSKAKPWWKFW